MKEWKHDYSLQIRESHLDTFGHVNNATYLALYEEARWEWITTNGYGWERVMESRKGPVILEATVTFRRELSLRDKVIIQSYANPYEGKIGVIEQQMVRGDGKIASEARFTYAYFDLDQRMILPPTPEWLAVFR